MCISFFGCALGPGLARTDFASGSCSLDHKGAQTCYDRIAPAQAYHGEIEWPTRRNISTCRIEAFAMDSDCLLYYTLC